jgi:DnaJ-class molecular chaperone
MANANTHTADCLQAQAQDLVDQAELAAWQAEWPEHCPNCGGTGNGSDSGVACSDCLDLGVCPRCAEALPGDSQDVDCTACGWIEGDRDIFGPPDFDPAGCTCQWEDASV